VSRLQTIVGLRADYNFLANTVKSYVELRLQPSEDKYYLIEVINDPRGFTQFEQTDVDTTDTTKPPHYREVRTVTTNAFRFSLMFAKRLGPFTGRFGIKESTGGIGIDYTASGGGHLTLSATNVIAHGASTDLFVQATSPDNATINIDHSNYGIGSGSGTGAHINSTAKQSAPPLFVNAAAGDFNEVAGSPTINSGITSDANGPFDVLGKPRVIDGLTDIGAYEFDPFKGVALANQNSKVKKRKAKVAIGCPAGTPTSCAGTLTLTYSGKKTAGSAAFSIPTGGVAIVKVKISKKALKKLAKRRKLATTASAGATDGAGIYATASATVKLKS